MTSLAQFQSVFAQALLWPQAASVAATDPLYTTLVNQPGFAVYRNTVRRGCIDALQANFPAVLRVVGEDWFRAAAAEYLRDHWPAAPMLIDYGDRFAEFLAEFAPARDLPYLPAVARLDRSFTESHLAADAPLLAAPQVVAAVTAAGAFAGELRLVPHPAARWHWFDTTPALTLWQRNRDAAFGDAALDWRGEGALLTRPAGDVQVRPLTRAAATLLDTCAQGMTLEEALDRAAAHAAVLSGKSAAARDTQINAIGRLLPELVAAGAFTSFR